MQNTSVPLYRQSGIDVIWHGQSMHDPDGYGLIRGFADMTASDQAQAAFHASDAWKTGPREAIIARIETATKVVIPMNEIAILPQPGASRAGGGEPPLHVTTVRVSARVPG